MDTLSKARRSANMAAIRAKNTKPEVSVRKWLFQHGLRFRLHSAALPGKPDIVFPRKRVAVFVHGCFWHGCKKCVDGKRTVKSNSQYWMDKILRNIERDRRHRKALRDAGWKVLTIWECETSVDSRLRKLLGAIQETTKQRTTAKAQIRSAPNQS